jgi:hypothetical protein
LSKAQSSHSGDSARPPQALLAWRGQMAGAMALVVGLLAACETAVEPVISPGVGHDLGPGAWLPDGSLADLAGDAIGDAADVSDADSGEPGGEGEPCDPLAPACATGLKCALSLDGGGSCQTVVAQPRQVGEACGETGADDCAADLACWASRGGEALHCVSLCDSSEGTGCEAVQTCQPLPEWLTEGIGVCIQP